MIVIIALLQGVNIGKSKRISMADLKRIVVELGGIDPVTVANSGNVVYEDGPDAATLEKAISDHVGVSVPVIVRTAADLRAIVDANPYPAAADEPKSLHVDFLNEPKPGALEGIDQGKDALTMYDSEIYMHLPNLVSGATYDARTLGKRLGTHHTSRNWATVLKLLDLAEARER